MRIAIALLALVAGIYAAQAFGLGEGNRFGKLGAISNGAGTPTPPAGNFALLVNNTDPALLVDNTNAACLVGGC